MRLHIGCGRRVWPGWLNIDLGIEENPPLTMCSDIRRLDRVPDGVATHITAVHIIEHIDYWDVLPTLREWRRVAAPGCLLVLEQPDIVKCAKNLLRGGKGAQDKYGMWGFYGNPNEGNPLMMHRWGWTAETLTPQLLSAGWREARERPPEYHAKEKRDFRVEAVA